MSMAVPADAQTREDPSRPAPICDPATMDSPFIPVDSWIYPAIMRLYGLGFIDNVFIGMRPWTRASVSHMLDEAGARIEDADANSETDEAQAIYDAINKELEADMEGPCGPLKGKSRIESVYTTMRAVSGTPLNDSFHLGQTVVNDYGRPVENGFNNYTGMSGYAAAGRFLLYARGEFQRAPSASGYSTGLAQTLATIDTIPYINPSTGLPYNNATIPMGPIDSTTTGRVLEAYVSAHVMNHEISFGKQDDWLGPGLGGGMAYSNNAENIYSFRIDRVEPLWIPLLSRLTGPFRYDFLVGSLKGHVAPNDPWLHVEKISFKPTENLEFGFERSVIWGGKGHVPITLHSFLKSFFSFQNVTAAEKFSRNDPGARFGSFDFSYRLPHLRRWVTLYADGEVHDDVSPIDAPRRAAWRPGIYLSHVPHMPKLDVRLEGITTDPPVSTSNMGRFMYREAVQVQGYTNKGQIIGDWMGREGKGGQVWVTYHLSGNEWVQAAWRNQKVAKDFVPGGTTLNDVSLQVVKRLGKDFEFNGKFAYQRWKSPAYNSGAPVYPATENNVTTTTIQLTWFPGMKRTY
ncbi:MAG TPA: capsule assembly Wzi family protein [Terracidiphilus sp.]|nr:capsule assembly Wzi family protein [Terracidiphilus sp.]